MSFYQIFIIGSMPIVLPILFHSPDVFFIFNQIIGLNVNYPDINIYIYIISILLYYPLLFILMALKDHGSI